MGKKCDLFVPCAGLEYDFNKQGIVQFKKKKAN
jgi:hypothetical protein